MDTLSLRQGYAQLIFISNFEGAVWGVSYLFGVLDLSLSLFSALFPLQFFLPMVCQLIVEELFRVVSGEGIVEFLCVLLVEELREGEAEGGGKDIFGEELGQWSQQRPGSHSKHPIYDN